MPSSCCSSTWLSLEDTHAQPQPSSNPIPNPSPSCVCPWPSGQQLVLPFPSVRSCGAGMQGSPLCGGHSNPATPAAKAGNSHFPVNMGPRDPASALAKHWLHSSLWALLEGSQHPGDPPGCGAAARGTLGQAGSSTTSGEVLAGQMTAGLSLCLPARVKLDSWEAMNPDQCCCCSGKNAYF